MEWLWSILYGLVMGLSEFLPVSSDAHGTVLLRMFGLNSPPALLRLFAHLGCLLGLLFSCRRILARLRRSRRPVRSRRNRVDTTSVLTRKMLRTSIFLTLLPFLLYPKVQTICGSLNYLALTMIFNGVVLFLPRFFSSGNRDARCASRLDGTLMGIGTGLGVVPGMSRIGAAVSLASLRGISWAYALQIGLLLSIPALAVVLVFDGAAVASGGLSGVNSLLLLRCALCGACAFGGSCGGIAMMRFLAVKTGYTGFAYYCWGAALFTFILFMTI